MIESKKESKKVLTSSSFFVILAVISISVLILNNLEPFRNKFDYIGFVLFTILCIGMGIINRHSRSKLITVVAFFCIFLYLFLKK